MMSTLKRGRVDDVTRPRGRMNESIIRMINHQALEPGKYGGFTDVARALSGDDPDDPHVSRQGVYMWWSRRDRNGFPDPYTIQIMTKKGRKRRKLVFDIDEVRDWYQAYTPSLGGRKRHDEIDHPT